MSRIGLFFLLLPFCFKAQRLSNVDAVYTGSFVSVRFSILPGPYCSGYSILFTPDSSQMFTTVHEYAGICGEPNNATQYSYQHSGAIPNQMNFYKVRLEPFEESPVLRVWAGSTQQRNLSIFPNPCGPSDANVTVRVTGVKENTDLRGFLYSRFGRVERELLLRPSNGIVTLPVSDLPEGVYIFWTHDGDNVFAGKLIVID